MLMVINVSISFIIIGILIVKTKIYVLFFDQVSSPDLVVSCSKIQMQGDNIKFQIEYIKSIKLNMC